MSVLIIGNFFLNDVNYFSIVQAFENIVDVLINQVNFTNLSVVQTDLAFRGERVRA